MLTKKQMREAAAAWGKIGGKKGGRLGGLSKSPAKLAAIALNAKKGGRPRKNKSKRK